jgi:hypothetical protein
MNGHGKGKTRAGETPAVQITAMEKAAAKGIAAAAARFAV